MPELLDLEAIADFVRPRLLDVQRRGKFLLLTSDDEHVFVVDLMLTGRFTWTGPGELVPAGTAISIGFEDGHWLRYRDTRCMGRWYLVPADAVEDVSGIAELGPDALAVR